MEKDLRTNRQIRVPQVRLIGDDAEQMGVVNTDEALSLAESKELDLVEISPNASPPVCKILDYGKYKFDQKKRNREAQKKQKRTQLKEIKMRPKIDGHDYDFKKKHIETFLSKGDKVKVTLQFRGREMAHIDLGEAILQKLKRDLEGSVIIEKEPKLEGRQMSMILAPTK
ncbi:MAG TPA: translation initiation factor IF-3 [Spirochaetes bacterium]|nr:translation initiation factor IF-3 [Spirochaetota bacterium]